MKKNLKTIALALVAGFALAAASAVADCPAEPEKRAATPSADVAAAAQPTNESKAKPRRARRAKKVKSRAGSPEAQKKPVRRRRARKAQPAELPVTGMPDSAE